jgi:hypothetical protein
MKTVKLAEALLRRKELQEKMKLLQQIKNFQCFEVHVKRIKVSDGIDEVTAGVPKLELNQFTKEYDWHARQLRLLDAAIQQANWTCEVHVESEGMTEYKG